MDALLSEHREGSQVQNPFSPSAYQHNPRHVGYVFYQPKGLLSHEVLRYDPEAHGIVFHPGETNNQDGFSKHCRQWANRLDRKRTAGVTGSPAGFLDIYKSHRRRYAVSGVVMSHATPSGKNDGYYLFMVERVVPTGINLPMLARKWQLAPQEQLLVQWLLFGHSTKEIAHEMDLSQHTVKSYLKGLSRKLGVSGRAGIVSLLLFGTSAPQDLSLSQA